VVARRSTGFAIASAFVAYSVVAVVLTFPLVLRLSSTIPHDLGDPLLSASILWWNAHVMPLTARWWNGFAFFPDSGMLAYSDHRLGLSLIASPLQWLGADVVTAHNITFLATFPLSAISAHALAFTLTRRHDAATLCGLAYGFNPFRTLHAAHLELLAAYGMPLALAALHSYRETRRPIWLVGFTLAVILQGLCSSYYLLFFSVLLGLWILWFTGWREWRATLSIVAASAGAGAALWPIAAGYSRIHDAHGFFRSLFEVQIYSADLSSFVTASPMLSLWGWTSGLNGGEQQLFPGLTIVALAVAGVIAAIRRTPADHRRTMRGRRLSLVFLIASIAFSLIAMAVRVYGPRQFNLGWLTVSIGVYFKPLSLAVATYLAAVAFDPRMRTAYRGRSAFAFYVIASLALFVCTMGPKPTFLGQQFLYEPPYSWLMHALPVFRGGVRVPARFAMPAVLALSAAASLAFNRLSGTRARRIVIVIAAAGILTDSWVGTFPLPAIPDMWPAGRAEGFAAVAELPVTEIWRDAIAMYRATIHKHPTVNGMSGYDPKYYVALRHALANRDPTALDALTVRGPLLLVADKREGLEWPAFARGALHATPIAEDGRWAFFSLPPRPTPRICDGDALGVVGALDDRGPIDASLLTDDNPLTGWMTRHEQRAGDRLVLDLGEETRPCAVILSVGRAVELYPRALTVSTSLDGTGWTTSFSGKAGGLAVRAALEQPKNVRIPFALPGRPARYIRLQLDESDPMYPWLVTDVVVRGLARTP
jgi:hypothetical protein